MVIQPNQIDKIARAAELKPAVMRRIEWLGQMNDRRHLYRSERNYAALLELAQEYEDHFMINTARIIRKECNDSGFS